MLLIFVLSILAILSSGITTTPFALGILAVATVVFKKPSVFFLAFFLGLVLDLFLLRTLGQTGLIFSVFILTIWLYERKFETQTISFVFLATFLGSLVYLLIFNYQNIILQSLINSFLAILLFKFLSQNSKGKSQKYN